ncbi:MAG: hypothetical protein IPM27_12025 [Nitrosomonadales bacterium]|nr:hypothetical protein [Nitrosomonadales bacterium]
MVRKILDWVIGIAIAVALVYAVHSETGAWTILLLAGIFLHNLALSNRIETLEKNVRFAETKANENCMALNNLESYLSRLKVKNALHPEDRDTSKEQLDELSAIKESLALANLPYKSRNEYLESLGVSGLYHEP